jgi:hypothetical protein
VKRQLPAALVLVAGYACLPAACSSGSSGNGGGPDAAGDGQGTVDATPDVFDDPSNCVKPGTANNARGIAGYCNPGGGQCVKGGLGSQSPDCSGDYSGQPAHAWFCTIPCMPGMTDCGTGAACTQTANGTYCVPTSCAFLAVDGAAGDSGGEDGTGDGADSSSTDGSLNDAGTDGNAEASDGGDAG